MKRQKCGSKMGLFHSVQLLFCIPITCPVKACWVHVYILLRHKRKYALFCVYLPPWETYKAARKQGPKKKIYSHCERKLRQRVIRQHFLVSIPQSETQGDICLRLTSISILQTDFQLLVIHFHSFNKYLFSTNYIPVIHSLCIPFFGGTSRNAIFSFVLCNSLTLSLLKISFMKLPLILSKGEAKFHR